MIVRPPYDRLTPPPLFGQETLRRAEGLTSKRASACIYAHLCHACPCISTCVHVCICICVYIYIYIFTRIYVHLSIYASIHLCIYPSMHLSIYLSIYPYDNTKGLLHRPCGMTWYLHTGVCEMNSHYENMRPVMPLQTWLRRPVTYEVY